MARRPDTAERHLRFVVDCLDDRTPGLVMATFDLDMAARHRAAFGFFRGRRPELYGRLAQDI